MNNLTLLVMAAGMGSRYGGLKQLDPVGPNGETIIDYSVFDAIKAGFTKVIFIIRREFELEFKEKVSNKYADNIEIKYAFQELNYLPKPFKCPSERIKPWGTGHAILSAEKFINEPFVVINGDDFYGFESFKVISDFYKNNTDDFSMVAFRLDKTLSKFGSVTRGLCEIVNGNLDTVTETESLEKKRDTISSNRDITLYGNEPVSMNMWGFTPKLFKYLNEMIVEFLSSNGNELKSEFLIPSVINDLIIAKKESVTVLKSDSTWFGVTFKEDKPFVINEINSLINSKIYPKKLFK
ncbi:MAG: nucleotidyltransferase [Candidatus Marinimicrobia bacterium]|nr:nucleotidyltransferase [Candidatus Neomarinimicrobiota bacterium]